MVDIPIRDCQYVGPEQDPRRGSLHYCGAPVLAGKSYCGDHYWVIYKRGTALAGKKKEKAIDAEIADLKRQQEIAELEEQNG
jgi:hypothetical protein